jgi:hypothetical protein
MKRTVCTDGGIFPVEDDFKEIKMTPSVVANCIFFWTFTIGLSIVGIYSAVKLFIGHI